MSKTEENTSGTSILHQAKLIQSNFHELNVMFFNIHKSISHSKPINRDRALKIQKDIDTYMEYYRETIGAKVIPKLHFLEHHCCEWVQTWGFGMGLHGEQGGELVHSSIKKLEHQAQAIRRPEDQLVVIMKSHLCQVSPTLHGFLPTGKETQPSITQ